MQRKDEILAKKAKLAELRKQREEREHRQKESRRESLLDDGSGVKVPTPRRSTDRQDLDSFIETLVGERPGSRGTGTGNASPAGRKSRPSSTLSGVQVGSETYDESKGPSTPANYATASTQTQDAGAQTDKGAVSQQVPSQRKPEIITYHKAVQTAEEWTPQRHEDTEDLEDAGSEHSDVNGANGSMTRTRKLNRRQKEREEGLRQNLRKEIEEELRATRELTIEGKVSSSPSKYPARSLTVEELDAVTSSNDFLDFVERSSKVIEKALDEDYDVLADYAMDGIELADDDEDEGYGSMRGRKGRKVKQVAQFWDERWSRRRMITDIGFSPKFPELVLSAYTKNASAPQDPAGVLQIWNMHLHSRPEYTFHSSSDILSAKFSPFHPYYIVGGSYSGQVLLWDTRSRSPLPVNKTPLTGAASGGHTHPVYSISLVGTQNANNIISCSTDGVVCGWTTDMLTVPQEYLELTTPPPSKTEDLSPTCMSFPAADPTSFLVGTEEGTIYPCHRYDRAGAKAGVDARLRYRAHTAPVMSLDFHPVRGPVDLGDLALSSCLDWSVKIWRTRPASSAAAATTTTNSTSATTTSSAYSAPTPSQEQLVTPLVDLPREDIVYDARWSPYKPGVFSCVDGAGNLEVWDLTVDTEVPVSKTSPTVDQKVHGAFTAKSLDKITWEEKEGKKIAVGGAAGIVTVFELGSELAGDGVKNEEWTRMKRLMARMEAK